MGRELGNACKGSPQLGICRGRSLQREDKMARYAMHNRRSTVTDDALSELLRQASSKWVTRQTTAVSIEQLNELVDFKSPHPESMRQHGEIHGDMMPSPCSVLDVSGPTQFPTSLAVAEEGQLAQVGLHSKQSISSTGSTQTKEIPADMIRLVRPDGKEKLIWEHHAVTAAEILQKWTPEGLKEKNVELCDATCGATLPGDLPVQALTARDGDG